MPTATRVELGREPGTTKKKGTEKEKRIIK